MQRLTLSQVAQIVGGRLLQGADGALEVFDVALDSRAQAGLGQLFVALQGERFDAHQFLAQAHQRGWRAALVADESAALAAGFAHGVVVEDTLAALQALAHAHRVALGVPVVGITGSNGKTAVKELLASIMARRMTVYRSPGSYNSQVGVALSLLGIRPEHELAIIEIGISEPGEMARHEAMVRPDFGVLTHIGQAHIASLGSVAHIADEKAKLFKRAQWWLYPVSAAPLLGGALDERAHGFGQGASSFADEVRFEGGLARFNARVEPGHAFEVSVSALAAHDVSNALIAAAAALRLGATPEDVRAGLRAWEPAPMRLELHTTPRGVTLLNDAYSADPSSAVGALSALTANAMSGQRKVAVFGSMLGLGALSAQEHRRVGAQVVSQGVDRLYCVGELAAQIAAGALEAGMAQAQVVCVDDVQALSGRLAEELRDKDVVLFKASRAVGLEQAAETLLESFSPTRLTIDLGAIAQNFHAVRAHTGRQTKLMAVVKSYGYGNDATRVSKALVREGVDMLGVAYADEGVPLRDAGVDVPILVMNTLAGEVDKVVRWGLTGLVYSWEVAQRLDQEARRQGVIAPIHLKINTGMNRAGLKAEPALVVAFAERLRALPNLSITGIMTHLAAADEEVHDDFTRAQLERFDAVLAALKAARVDYGVAHAANTSAAWRFPAASYGMVRLGLGLYGLNPSDDVGQQSGPYTRSALRLTTQIIHLHEVEAGESVGYGRSYIAPSPRRLATIALGYSDGFPRAMSNGGEVLVAGRRCPVVGRVCMDVAVVDVSGVEEGLKVGDEVVIFGHQGQAFIAVDELAARAHTISYEILCNISARVRRVFVRF